MVCESCIILHDGILKGECRCPHCGCNEIWVNKKLLPKLNEGEENLQ